MGFRTGRTISASGALCSSFGSQHVWCCRFLRAASCGMRSRGLCGLMGVEGVYGCEMMSVIEAKRYAIYSDRPSRKWVGERWSECIRQGVVGRQVVATRAACCANPYMVSSRVNPMSRYLGKKCSVAIALRQNLPFIHTFTFTTMPSTHNAEKPWDTDDIDKWKIEKCMPTSPHTLSFYTQENITDHAPLPLSQTRR